MNFVDPNGLWTVGFSLNFGYGAGIGGIHGLNLVFDSNGNFDSQWINGAGGYAGAGLGTTLGFEISNAECIDQLLGNGYQHGAGGGFGIIGEVGTFGGSGYQGGYLGIGAGAGLPVGYGFYGTVTQPVSFPDISADSLMLQGR